MSVAKWDERYGRGDYASEEPNPLLARAVDEFAQTLFSLRRRLRALDVASGAGRHALLLAERGFQVTAVDASRTGVELMLKRARLRGLEIDARVADLEKGEFAIAPGAYDLICDFYYLQRDLFASMKAGVARGGLFVAAIHLEDEDPHVAQMNPDYLLAPDELREEFCGWQLLHYHETRGRDCDAGQHTRRSAEIIARRSS